jgi:hypothetical protein
MRIDSPNLVGSTVITGSAVVTGSVVPGSDLLYDFGSTLKRWGNVYAVNLSGSFTGSNVTAGQVIVVGTGGVLSGTNNLFWDNSATRLGIGTSALTSTLTLSGSSTATIPVLTVRQGAVTPGAASLDVQNRLGVSTFWVSGSGISFFSGSVGIGTTNPLFRLQLGNQTSTSTATPETISLGGTFSSTAGANPKLRLWTDGSTMFGLGVSTGQLDYTISGAGGSHVWYLAGSEVSRINSSGMSVTGSILPGQDIAYNLGSSTRRWANIFTGDLHLQNERGNWTIIEEDDCLTVRNNKTGKRYKINMTPMPELDEPLGNFSTGPKPNS